MDTQINNGKTVTFTRETMRNHEIFPYEVPTRWREMADFHGYNFCTDALLTYFLCVSYKNVLMLSEDIEVLGGLRARPNEIKGRSSRPT